MKRYIPILTLLFTLLLTSCEEIIEIDLNSSNPVVVVEGSIAENGLAQLQLSYTSDYYTNEASTKIEDAQVILTAENGKSEELKHMGNGFYIGQTLLGEANSNYSLTILYGEKELYGETFLPASIKILDIQIEDAMRMGPPEQVQNGDNPSREDIQNDTTPKYSLNIVINEELTQENYYMIKILKNGRPGIFGNLLMDDQFGQSQSTKTISPMMYSFNPGDTANIQIFSFDAASYSFYNQMADVAGGGMSMSMGTPYNPVSNMGEDVLGYFAAWAKVDTTFVVQP